MRNKIAKIVFVVKAIQISKIYTSKMYKTVKTQKIYV